MVTEFTEYVKDSFLIEARYNKTYSEQETLIKLFNISYNVSVLRLRALLNLNKLYFKRMC